MSLHDYDLPDEVASALGLAPQAGRAITSRGARHEVPCDLKRWAARRRTSATAIDFGWRLLCAPTIAFQRLCDGLVAATEGLAFTRDAAAVQVMFK